MGENEYKQRLEQCRKMFYKLVNDLDKDPDNDLTIDELENKVVEDILYGYRRR